MTVSATQAATGGTPKKAVSFNSDRQQLMIGIALIMGTGILPSLLGNSYWEHTFHLVNVYIAVAIIQNFLFVDAGQKSFGQGAILGLGAYGFAIAFGLHGWSLILAALVGIAAATVGGLLFALPALRVQGFHLGFVTMSAAIVFPQLLNQMAWLTRGINGISVNLPMLAQKPVFGLSWLTILLTLVPIAALVFHYVLRNSRLGRRMRIASESPEAARSLGISPGIMRALAFVIASAITGLCGVLLVPAVSFLSPQGFLIDLSFIFFFAVVVGGRGQLLGPIVGIWVIFILPSVLLVQLVEWKPLVYGVLTLLAVLAFPDGIIGTIEAWRRKRNQQGGGEGGFRVASVNDAFAKMTPVAPKNTTTPVVSVRGVTKRFGRVTAIDGVNMDVMPGEIHGLVGANGSGKTSLLNVISGFTPATEGSYKLNGQDVTRKSAAEIGGLGIGRTFQNPRIFQFFSVWNNIRVGIDARKTPLEPQLQTLADRLSQDMAEDTPTLLSHGQRRLLEVVRVIMKDSDIVLFDEPAAGLSPQEREEFGQLVRHLSRTLGKAVILVEHDLDLVWGIADRITVLETGKVVASGTPADLSVDPAVQHLFVGGDHA